VCLSGVSQSNGIVKLPLIKNKKTVNPRDSSSKPVFQLETAMGSAVEVFPDAGAVVVPRSRFAPVKTTNDLFALRSDAYTVGISHMRLKDELVLTDGGAQAVV
jgi:UTP--glucose-1-phosphate uridylyltransferase